MNSKYIVRARANSHFNYETVVGEADTLKEAEQLAAESLYDTDRDGRRYLYADTWVELNPDWKEDEEEEEDEG